MQGVYTKGKTMKNLEAFLADLNALCAKHEIDMYATYEGEICVHERRHADMCYRVCEWGAMASDNPVIQGEYK